MTWDLVKVVLLAILSAGGALAIRAFFDGIGLMRSGTAKTEARGIANLERQRELAEHATLVSEHRVEYYRDELGPWKDQRIADLERVIRVELGREFVPELHEAKPRMRPLPAMPKELEEKVTGDVDA